MAAVLAGGLVVAVPASAAPSTALIGACTSSSTARTSDPYSHTFSMRRYCPTANAPVHSSAFYDSNFASKGTLNAGNDWFLCYVIGSPTSGTYGSSNYWYYTHGDTYSSPAHNSWGFVGSGWINALDANITVGMPQCTFTFVPM
ncbi:hypothetical protein Psi02_27980 [Planotetraspora silvatica]|uniref:Secreted protein n=2 Tax=Planotetraspora silvatica TaxID=234614 RepID=A0A8J3UIK1_9ACTN|nr:hypothetical protein Psi02_27980 [Planotetraspora silvatica]